MAGEFGAPGPKLQGVTYTLSEHPMDTEVRDDPDPQRPSVLQLVLHDEAQLHAAYMPLFKHGGVFVPTVRDYHLGDEVYLLITLPGEEQRYPVLGKVAWIAPPRALGSRVQGVGVHFSGDDKSDQLKARIEELLGTLIATERPTQTI